MSCRTPKEPPARVALPKRLAYTAFHVALGGTLACGTGGDRAASPVHAATADAATADAATADAASDAPRDDSDAAIRDGAPSDAEPSDDASDALAMPCDGQPSQFYCGPESADASCPGYVCDLSECPSGCEPYS